MKSIDHIWVVSWAGSPERFFLTKEEAEQWMKEAWENGLVDATWEGDKDGRETEGTEMTLKKWEIGQDFYDDNSSHETYEFERFV